jgi:hypothetical protein
MWICLLLFTSRGSIVVLSGDSIVSGSMSVGVRVKEQSLLATPQSIMNDSEPYRTSSVSHRAIATIHH